MGGNGARVMVSRLIEEGVLLINDGYRAKNSELSSEGLPFARAQNINSGFRFDDEVDRFPEKDLHKVGVKVSQPGDVVFTSKGTVGRFAYVRTHTPSFVYSPQLCFWRSLNHKKLHPQWLYYWMHSREFFEQYSGVAGQTDMAEYVSLRDQRRMHITVPPIDRQRAIACILGSLDDKIELNRRMNRTLEEMARAIFKSWFIDFDPVRAKAAVRRQHPKWTDDQVSRAACPKLKPEIARLFPDSFEDSELGEIPKGWRVKALDELARFLNGLALQKFPPEDGDSLPVIKIAQLRAGNTVGADRASARLNPDYIVQDGDILFSWSGSLECVLWAGGPGALNQHLFKVTSNEYPKWLCYLAVHQHLDEFRHIAASKATTMGHIQRHHLAGAKIAVPVDENLLSAIDAVLDPMFESLWQREVSCRTLAALRDALLPKLVSGELRIPDAERIAGRCA